jgi:hypothetical protein
MFIIHQWFKYKSYDTIKVFFFPHKLMHKWTVLKTILKFTLKLTLKELLHVSVQSPSSGSALFELAKVTVVKAVHKFYYHILTVTWAKMTGTTPDLLQTESTTHDAVLFHVRNEVRWTSATLNTWSLDKQIQSGTEALSEKVKNIILCSTFPVQSSFTSNTLQ